MFFMSKDVTLIDYVCIFFKGAKKIICCVLFSLAISLIYACLTPEVFKAECRVLPSSQGGNNMAMTLSQMGSIGVMAGLLGGPTTGELLCGLLRGQTVVDRIIDQFDLMELYKQKSRIKMREKVVSDILIAAEDMKSKIVTIAVLDKEPERAALMANAFVEELNKVLQSLSIGEAAQRRLFFERHMLEARKTMGDAEDELKKYQEKSGLVVMEPQVEAMLTSIAALRAQVAAKEVELSAIRSYARGSNPDLRRAESELSALRGELAKLEQMHKTSDEGTPASLREAPQLGLEYQRRLRDVQFSTAMYELMFRQFEAAKIDESREVMAVQIVDSATPPDHKYKPKIIQILAVGMLIGLCLGMFWAILSDYISAIKKDPEQKHVLEEVKAAIAFRK
jgi:uncharacterized protein involved in exopolysaccharide biosynthesis